MDRKLDWHEHIDDLVLRANKSLNIIRTLAKVTYGAHPESMLAAYRGLTRSLLEWASILFANTGRCRLIRLDRVQFSALRIALGCMRTTPIPILLSEAGEPTLEHRRSLLLNRNSIRISSWTHNHLLRKLEDLSLEIAITKQTPKYLYNFPPLKHLKPVGDLSSSTIRPLKPAYYDRDWAELIIEVEHIIDKETDGSYAESSGRASSSFFTYHRLNLDWVAELNGIHSALKHSIEEDVMHPLILTDSMKALQTIKDRLRDSESRVLVHEIASMIMQLIHLQKDIKMLWIPSHSNIPGNEEADRLSKLALNLPVGKKPSFQRKTLKV
ncbi:uncharacterized protein LOC122502235 [Leptopilina heterotoma]|uniref:uncharacterized protein LOC122502235 n=1 Tax=Leptopilina heterotoma TaxID=63436 RepID=UPI001CA9CD5E|nr:uncharacterized protein LOC122502235 [Leptopilina heterotoma]